MSKNNDIIKPYKIFETIPDFQYKFENKINNFDYGIFKDDYLCPLMSYIDNNEIKDLQSKCISDFNFEIKEISSNLERHFGDKCTRSNAMNIWDSYSIKLRHYSDYIICMKSPMDIAGKPELRIISKKEFIKLIHKKEYNRNDFVKKSNQIFLFALSLFTIIIIMILVLK